MPGVTEDMLARMMAVDFDRWRGARSEVAALLDRGKPTRTSAVLAAPTSRSISSGREGIPDDGDLTRARGRSATSHAARGSSPRSAARDGSSRRASRRWGSASSPRPDRRGGPDRRRPRAASGPSSSSCSRATASTGLNLAELGVGTNERAQLTGHVLEDEKILGTVHVAFGASAGIGGNVSVPIHLDVVVLDATLDVDGRRVLDAGRYVLGDVTRCSPYPNVSEGRDRELIDAIGARSTRDCSTSTPTPTTIAACSRSRASPPSWRRRSLGGAREADRAGSTSTSNEASHPRVGAIDVAPIVYLNRDERGAACAEALVLGDLLGDAARAAGVPVRRARRRPDACRAAPRGPGRARARIDSGELGPDFGPPRLHPTAGAVLVAARPPLVAFNVELAPPRRSRTRRRSPR